MDDDACQDFCRSDCTCLDVIPKMHYPNYAFDLPDGILTGLVLAAKTVGKLLDEKFY